MKTYRLYVRNEVTRFQWVFCGTIRAKSEKDAWKEVHAMEVRNPDSSFRIIEQLMNWNGKI